MHLKTKINTWNAILKDKNDRSGIDGQNARSK